MLANTMRARSLIRRPLAPSRGYKVVVPELDDRILDTGDEDRILKSHQRNASFAMRRMQQLQKQDRAKANERKHAFFTKPNQNKVRLSELKVGVN